MRHFLFCLIILASCSSGRKEHQPQETTSVQLKYAAGFEIEKMAGVTKVTVKSPYQQATKPLTYWLVKRGEAHSLPPSATVIEVPVSSIVCTSTTHIPHLDYLDQTDKLIGFPTTDYISSPAMRARIDTGAVADLGIDANLDVEKLYTLRPSMVMGYTITDDWGPLKRLPSLGIPVVINAEYLEKHPLGRAEWIKFTALFFGQEQRADSVFNAIEKAYTSTVERVNTLNTRPTAMTGVVYGDAWFMPGGQNYAATILRDAGFDYLWAADSSSGFLQIAFESVYDRAKAADFWLGVGSFNSLAEIEAADKRYAMFKPFQTGKVFTYNARQGAKGGSEFLELGYLRPDIVLKDLVRIAHPELLPDHQLYFYSALPQHAVNR